MAEQESHIPQHQPQPPQDPHLNQVPQRPQVPRPAQPTQTPQEPHDFIDDLIEFQQNWTAVRNPLGSITDQLVSGEATPTFDAASYKEQPWANASRCLVCSSKDERACTKCLDVCPVDAITIKNQSVSIADSCKKCGLCWSVCPTDVFSTHKYMPRMTYEKIVRAASAYKQVYVTCTRAFGRLGRMPRENEIVLPCVGALSEELWFSLLADYNNIMVYLPLGICDRCPISTGEEVYTNAIATSEQWAETSVGLEVDADQLNADMRRDFLRAQFVSSVLQSAETLLTRTTPVLAGAKAIAEKISAHAKQLDRLQSEIEKAVGTRTSENRQRMLTQGRKFVMGALQTWPEFAKNIQTQVPVWDRARCTLCGDCSLACTPRAINIDRRGNLTIAEQYCVGCGVCELVCKEDALVMEPRTAEHLVVIDREAIEHHKQAEAAKAEARALLNQGKQQAKRLLSALEAMDPDAGGSRASGGAGSAPSNPTNHQPKE